MTEYKCQRCHKIFDKKYRLKNHLNRKFKCELKKNKYICDICDKSFTRKDNLIRHKKKYCKTSKELLIDNENMMKEIEELKGIIKKQDLKFEKKMKKLEKIKETKISNNNIIQINAYGKEDIDHINYEDYMEYIRLPITGVKKIIKNVHFNENTPQNHNLYISDLSRKYIKIYNGEKWINKMKKPIIKNITTKNFSRLEKFFKKNKNYISDNIQNRFIRTSNKNNNDNDFLYKELNSDIECILYDNKKMINK